MSDVTTFSSLQLESSLPSLPAAALEVLLVCQDTNAEIDDLAAALARDPMLASRVLRLANSAMYRRRTEVTSLQRAAVLLGMRTLKIAALGFTLSTALPRRGVWAGLDLGAYWQRSLVNAVVARALARATRNPLTEEAFLCGLLADIGKLALTHAMPEPYGPIVAEGGGWPSDELERLRLGFPASEAAEAMLTSWQVPELVVLGATYAGRPDELPAETPEDARRLAELVGLARLGAGVLFDQDPRGLVAFTTQAEQRFGLSAEEAESLVGTLQAEVEEAAGLLSLEVPEGVSYGTLLEQARVLMVSMTLDAVMHLDEPVEEDELPDRRARTDGLTGLPNHATADVLLTQQVHLRLRDELPGQLGLILIDLDGFGRFNDTFGHQAGDEALRSIGRALQEATRKADMLARYGGDEYCVVVPAGTPEALTIAAERLREAIEGHDVDLGALGTRKLTASFGCAFLTEVTSAADATSLVAAAEAQLSSARLAGNTTAIEPQPVVAA